MQRGAMPGASWFVVPITFVKSEPYIAGAAFVALPQIPGNVDHYIG
jgi:hypothetical protein